MVVEVIHSLTGIHTQDRPYSSDDGVAGTEDAVMETGKWRDNQRERLLNRRSIKFSWKE